MNLSPVMQKRLETRGITCTNDAEFVKLATWFRFTPLLSATLIGLGTGFAFTPLLWVMVPIVALGVISPRHPFDLIYNYGMRHLTGTQPLPRNGASARFASGTALVLLVGTAIAFELDVAWLGYALGGVLISVAALVSVTHFCIPSMVYQLLFGRRAMRSSA